MSATKTKPSKAIKTLVEGGIWDWVLHNYGGRAKCKILSVSNNNNDSLYLQEEGHLHVDWTTAENISAIPPKNQFQITIATYANKYLEDEFSRNNFLYELGERTYREGQVFVSLSKSSKIKLEMNEIVRNETFTMYLL
jgi:hypothetical protein